MHTSQHGPAAGHLLQLRRLGEDRVLRRPLIPSCHQRVYVSVRVRRWTSMAVIVCGRTRGSVSSCISQSVHLHPPLPPHVCRCPNSKDPRSPRAGTGGPPPGSTYTTPDGTVITRAGGNIPDELLGEISNNVGTLSMANTGALSGSWTGRASAAWEMRDPAPHSYLATLPQLQPPCPLEGDFV